MIGFDQSLNMMKTDHYPTNQPQPTRHLTYTRLCIGWIQPHLSHILFIYFPITYVTLITYLPISYLYLNYILPISYPYLTHILSIFYPYVTHIFHIQPVSYKLLTHTIPISYQYLIFILPILPLNKNWSKANLQLSWACYSIFKKLWK